MADESPPLTPKPHVLVPGMWQLAWLLFMQPLRLHRLHNELGFRRDPSLWSLRHRLGNAVSIRLLIRRYAAILLVVLPLLAMLTSILLLAGGTPFPQVLSSAAGGVVMGVGVGVPLAIAWGVGRGVAFGVAFGVALLLAFGVTGGLVFGAPFVVGFVRVTSVAFGVAFGVALGLALGMAECLESGVTRALAFGLVIGVVEGMALAVFGGVTRGIVAGMSKGVADGVAYGAALSVTFILSFYRLWSYPLECLVGSALMAWARGDSRRSQRVAAWLPFRLHDLLRSPLPGLQRFLVDLAEAPGQESLTRQLLAECAESLGQKGAARAALGEIQARSLERAAGQPALYAAVKTLSLPFLPGEDTPANSVFRAFQVAAGQLQAALANHNQFLRADNLRIARQALEQFSNQAISDGGSDPKLSSRLQPVARRWLDVVQAAQRRLEEEQQERPELPMLFHQGNPLRPEDGGLFKGRTDIFRKLEEDLAAPSGAPIFLFGQRRVGKTSVVNFLPVMLGENRRVVLVNFQRLSGSVHRASPYHEIADGVAQVWQRSPPASTQGWGAVLQWLAGLDQELEQTQERMLVVIDEVEGMEQAGPGRDDTLDFLRAAGDSLKRTRFLLVGARSPEQLGREWTRRLISALLREIDYLDEASARDLLTNPSDEERYRRLFADLYPPGAIERILAQTACQPCLLQHVMANLVSRLNQAQRLRADPADIEHAIDATPDSASNALTELWQELEPEAQQAVRTLLPGYDGPAADPKVLRALQRRGYVTKPADTYQVRIPLFQRWILLHEEE